MLRIDKQQTLEGVTVYGDGDDPTKFYLLPSYPTYHRNPDGTPSFRFIMYRNPVDHEGGDQGGGYCIFSTELAVSPEKEKKIRSALQNQIKDEVDGEQAEVKLASPRFTDGSVNLLIMENKELVEAVGGSGKPSLVNKNVATFNAELSPEGAALFESALQGEGGSVGVEYDLSFKARLPPLKAEVWFSASKFYDFVKSRETEERSRGFFVKAVHSLFGGRTDDTKKVREEIRETMRQNEFGGVDITFQGLPSDMSSDKKQKIKGNVRDWAWRTLEDAMKRMAIDGIKKATSGQKKVPKNATDFKRTIDKNAYSSFRQTYTEQHVVDWDVHPNGILPSITSLKDEDGNPIKWEDHASKVDLDHAFFNELNVQVRVNADFDALSLHSVEVKMDYPHGEEAKTEEFAFDNPDTVHTFRSRMADGKDTYRYAYEVNYQGESRTFSSSEQETDERVLTVGVDDVGVLAVDVEPGDLNFEQVNQVQLTLQYEDSANNIGPIERQYTIDKDNQRHQLKEVVFEPVKEPYRYRMKYFMTDGREYELDWKEARADTLYVNDPFSATKTYSIRAVGDLKNDIQDIFLDLEYRDDTNDYAKSTSIALDSEQSFYDWAVPVIDETQGALTYSGTITYQDGTQEEIPSQTTDDDTIMVGSKVEDRLEVDVIADLVDWSNVELVKVDLAYQDAANDITEDESLVFRGQENTTKSWTVDLENEQKTEYTWQATFYRAEDGKKETNQKTTSEDTIVLEMPQ